MNRRQLLALCGSSLFASGSHLALQEAHADPVSSLPPGPLYFQVAKPVWPIRRETEMNLFVGFRAVFDSPPQGPTVLHVAASTLYRLFVNGEFRGYGPARGPYGFFRVDEWDITSSLAKQTNIVAIEVAGYNINSYYFMNQPSFLQAEITAGSEVLAATADHTKPFKSSILSQRVQKVERYSLQRMFSEIYHLHPGTDAWRSDVSHAFDPEPCAASAQKQLIPRRVAYPQFERRQPARRVMHGEVFTTEHVGKLERPFFLTHIGPALLGFKETELSEIPSFELQHVANKDVTDLDEPYSWSSSFSFSANRFHLFDFGTDLTGFIGARVTARTRTRLFLTFDEMLLDGDVNFERNDTVNIVAYELAPGEYNLESFEPYTLRFLKFIALEGDGELSEIYLREYANPNVWTAHFDSSDQDLNLLFHAGRECFRQNSVDLLTDCPSRERAGWLCDSGFTARAEHRLTGGSTVEGVFFENYVLPDSFAHLPEGMLPACYPADHYSAYWGLNPNWAMWFILELREHLQRSGNHEIVAGLRPKIMKLFDYFGPFRNEYGLLEKLKGCVFVEWSAANNFLQDVNYPTNMLYAAALEAAGEMYKVRAWVNEAAAVRKTIRTQSFDGTFFVDNALRVGRKLVPTHNRTETCQYYAFYFGTATPATYGTLWKTLVNDFGPRRKQTRRYPEIPPSNALIGHIMRLELLSSYGSCEQLIDEAKAYLVYMAKLTGTLWENDDTSASLNHGFQSNIVNVLYRDVLGLYQVDWVRRRIHVRFRASELESCEGRIPVPGGAVSLRWRKQGGQLSYRLNAPAGYTVTIENESALPLATTDSGR
jgi:alpha-L-rhamnosidase